MFVAFMFFALGANSMDIARAKRLQALVTPGGFGLEIGPSHNPVFPRAHGFNVEVLDYMSADGLRVKYKELGVAIDMIEEVDYISDGRPLHEVINRRGEYDFIFSSHTIEHVTDFVGYIKSCETLLKPGGIIALAVPDKRYTFDVFQPISTTGRALEAFYRKQTRHSPASVYDFIANFVVLDNKEVWTKYDIGQLRLPHAIEGAKALLEDTFRDNGPYHDVHGWSFTPNSFRLIIHDLKKLGMIGVDEFYMHEEGCLEFHVGLSSTARGHGLDRVTLQRNILREHVVSGIQMLAADDPVYASVFETVRQG